MRVLQRGLSGFTDPAGAGGMRPAAGSRPAAETRRAGAFPGGSQAAALRAGDRRQQQRWCAMTQRGTHFLEQTPAEACQVGSREEALHTSAWRQRERKTHTTLLCTHCQEAACPA